MAMMRSRLDRCQAGTRTGPERRSPGPSGVMLRLAGSARGVPATGDQVRHGARAPLGMAGARTGRFRVLSLGCAHVEFGALAGDVNRYRVHVQVTRGDKSERVDYLHGDARRVHRVRDALHAGVKVERGNAARTVETAVVREHLGVDCVNGHDLASLWSAALSQACGQ